MKRILVLIAVAVVVGGAVFVLTNSRTKRSSTISGVRQTLSDNGFKISEGKNVISGEYLEAESIDFGIKIYPSATPIQDQKAAGNFNANGVKITSATYQTNHARDRVETFYLNQFGSDAVTGELVDKDIVFKVIKSKNNTGPIVNVWVENSTTYFTLLKQS